jgi:hypothetical protein
MTKNLTLSESLTFRIGFGQERRVCAASQQEAAVPVFRHLLQGGAQQVILVCSCNSRPDPGEDKSANRGYGRDRVDEDFCV